MNQDEVESQLSAMLDGELPAAECELLSRRIDRDENLRARWSRYALIGAAMRFEPVATAHRNFAARVSSALERADGETGTAAATATADAAGTAATASPTARGARTGGRTRGLWWQTALAAGLVGAVAGLSITMLRNNVTLDTTGGASAVQSVRNALDARAMGAVLSLPVPVPQVSMPQVSVSRNALAGAAGAGHEPKSYVTPPDEGGAANTPLRTELVDYIVAHSEYSTPLMRPDLLSELISGEDIDATPSPASASGR